MGTLCYLALMMLGIVYAHSAEITLVNNNSVDVYFDKRRNVCFEYIEKGASPLTENSKRMMRAKAVLCPEDKPVCATQAVAPDFISQLVCSSVLDQTCTVSCDEKKVFSLICMCTDDLCNAPFKEPLLELMIDFKKSFLQKFLNATFNLSDIKNMTDLFFTDMLNDSYATYDELTMQKMELSAKKGVLLYQNQTSNFELMPRAEALRRESTPPSDDDEDENEGSGSSADEERATDVAPTATSSWPPTDDNLAPRATPAAAAAALATAVGLLLL